MRINKLLLTTAIVSSAFFSVAANAQVSTKNFIGPSVEVGLVHQNTKLNERYEGDSYSDRDEDYGAKFSAQYGFQTAVPNIVIGVGASYIPTTTKVFYEEYKIKNAMAVYVEPTYVLSDSTAVFGKLSYNRASRNISLPVVDDYGVFYDKKDTLLGIGIGAGVVHFVKKDVFLKAEIESVNYGSETIPNWSPLDPFGLKTTQLNTTVSVGMKF
jgi:hypothetical protein